MQTEVPQRAVARLLLGAIENRLVGGGYGVCTAGSLSVRRGQIQTGRKRNVWLSAVLSSAALGVTKSYYIAWRRGLISTTVASMPWPTSSAARTRLGWCGEGFPLLQLFRPAK